MFEKKLSVIALTLVMVLVLAPTIFAELDIDFDEYGLDISDEQEAAIIEKLEELIDKNDQITEEDILAVLEKIKVEEEEETEDTPDENEEEENEIGKELSEKIETWKEEYEAEGNEEYKSKGQFLSDNIQDFLDEKLTRDGEEEEEEQNQVQDQEQEQKQEEEKSQEMEEKGMPDDVKDKVEEKKSGNPGKGKK
ncbi:MAG TPA: hypothetical protein VKN64_02330 [Halanaerobiales bacterium]|nr:hypothetical protein [Halanaerobiales bacterium]